MDQQTSTLTQIYSSLLERLGALEGRVAALESQASSSGGTSPLTRTTGEYWVVDGVEASRAQSGARAETDNEPDNGALVFGGSVRVSGHQYAYQWQRETDYLLGHEWDEYTERIAAIAHPVRGAILRRLLTKPATVAELVEEAIVSSTGTGYHHLGALQDAGWVAKLNGHFEVRPARVVPLLTIIAAGEDH